jgi:hypothetical protein
MNYLPQSFTIDNYEILILPPAHTYEKARFRETEPGMYLTL